MSNSILTTPAAEVRKRTSELRKKVEDVRNADRELVTELQQNLQEKELENIRGQNEVALAQQSADEAQRAAKEAEKLPNAQTVSSPTPTLAGGAHTPKDNFYPTSPFAQQANSAAPTPKTAALNDPIGYLEETVKTANPLAGLGKLFTRRGAAGVAKGVGGGLKSKAVTNYVLPGIGTSAVMDAAFNEDVTAPFFTGEWDKLRAINTIVNMGLGAGGGAAMKNHPSLGLNMMVSAPVAKDFIISSYPVIPAAKNYFNNASKGNTNPQTTLQTTPQTTPPATGNEANYAPLLWAALGLGSLGVGGYLANSYLNRKRDNDNIYTGRKNVALEIPAEKINDSFYTRLGREILFKDENEDKRIAEKKETKKAASEGWANVSGGSSAIDAYKKQHGEKKFKNLPQTSQDAIFERGVSNSNNEVGLMGSLPSMALGFLFPGYNNPISFKQQPVVNLNDQMQQNPWVPNGAVDAFKRRQAFNAQSGIDLSA